jgi:hypothetical protein
MFRVMEQFGAAGAMSAPLPTFQTALGKVADSRDTQSTNWQDARGAMPVADQVVGCGNKFCHIAHLNGPPR